MSSSIKSVVDQFINGYIQATRETFASHEMGRLVRESFPEALYDTLIDRNNYLVRGSVGQGNWATIPWLCIFDRRITTTAQSGVYIVYLLSSDGNALYLTLNQGCTDLRNQLGKAGAINKMHETSNAIRSKISMGSFISGTISLGRNVSELGKLYGEGCICYKKYQKGLVPTEEELINDLAELLDIYDAYYQKIWSAADSWFPTLSEYNPGITKEQWLEILKKENFLTANIYYTLAAFYKNGGQASCIELWEKNGKSSDFYRNCGSSFGEKVVYATGIPKFGQKNAEYWPIAFQGRNAGTDERGNYIWKLRPELYDALTEFEIWNYLKSSHMTGKFYSWEIIDETTAIKNCDKSFFEFANSGVPREISWFFGFENALPGDTRDLVFLFNGTDYKARIKNDSTDRTRTAIYWFADLKDELSRIKRSRTAVIFKRITFEKYELSIKGGEVSVTIKQKLDEIKKYIASRGFTYDGALIEDFYLSLKSKPFVILAGTSGTGKTRLAKLFAEAIDAEFKLVPVRPDWSDSSDLFGHLDLSGSFIEGPVIEFIADAIKNPSKPYFLCLDEMNLARVEYYFSDFLSIIETREREDGRVVTDEIKICGKAKEIYGELYIPDNLYIIGTVNMDETTFPFSKKVLDRANTIEFSFVDLTPRFDDYDEDSYPVELQNSFMKTEFIKLSECAGYADFAGEICTVLAEINSILTAADAHIGYRVRDEICFYMINNKNADLLSENDAMDNQIMQKILPRIQGSSAAVKTMLCELFKLCAGDFSGYQTDSNVADEMRKTVDKGSCKYKNSAEKIAGMVRRFEEDGFTSYWI